MMNSNMGMAIICMVNSTEYDDNSENILANMPMPIILLSNNSIFDGNNTKVYTIPNLIGAPKVNWSSEEQGYVFGAFNIGLLSMLIIGLIADKINAKYMIIAAMLIASVANFLIGFASSLRYS